MSASEQSQQPPADVAVDSKPATRPSGGGARLPSLTQLAARIGSSATPSSTSSSRPRLATSLLRSNSQVSTLTNATANSSDSTAVNAPTTRPVSPTASDRSNASAVTTSTYDLPGNTSAPPEGIPALIVDKEEKLIRGYKNIPSLNAITERMRRTKLANVQSNTDSTSIVVTAPPADDLPTPTSADPEPVDATKAEEEDSKEEHPLQHTWTLFYDTKAKVPSTPYSATAPGNPPLTSNPEGAAYEAGLTVVGEFKTVEGFCRYFNWLKPPSKLERSSNYHLFKDGIKPMWEDTANANGGKWVMTIKSNPQLLDRCWSWLAMALVGEELDEKDEICGAVVSLRAKIDRIQLWTRGKDDVESINSLGKKLVKLLDVADEPGIGLEFQYNTEDKPTPNKFLSIQSNYAQPAYGGYRQSPVTATATGFPNLMSPDTPSPLSQIPPINGPILPLKTQNVAALETATGTANAPAPAPAGGAGVWRPKRTVGEGNN